MRHLIAIFLIPSLLGACTVVYKEDETEAPGTRTYGAPTERPAQASESESPAPEAEQDWVAEVPLSDIQREIFNDPAFKKLFAESYLSDVEVEPEVAAEERESMQGVLALLGEEKYAEAAAMLEATITDRSSGSLDFILGNLYFSLERFEDAADAYFNAVQKAPKFRRAWTGRAQVAFKLKRLEEAAEAYGKVISLGNPTGTNYGLMGIAHWEMGNYLSAETAFRNALLLDPRSDSWVSYLADTFYKQERYADAIALYADLIRKNPDDQRYWLSQGEAYREIGQLEKAAANFEIADGMGGSTWRSLINLGAIYTQQEAFSLAADAFVRAMELAPEKDLAPFVAAAQVFIEAGQTDESDLVAQAITRTGEARLDDGQMARLLDIRSRIAAARGDQEKEAEVLLEVVKRAPDDGSALLRLGYFFRTQKLGTDPEDSKAVARLLERATTHFERASRLEKWEAQARIGLAQLAADDKRFDVAAREAKRAYELDNRDQTRRYYEAMLRFSQNK